MRRSSLRVFVVFAVLVPGCATTLHKPAFVIPPASHVNAVHISRINSDPAFREPWMDRNYPIPKSPVIEDRHGIENIMELLSGDYRAWRPALGTESQGRYFIDIESRSGTSLALKLNGNELVEPSSRRVRKLNEQELHQLERLLGIEPPTRTAR